MNRDTMQRVAQLISDYIDHELFRDRVYSNSEEIFGLMCMFYFPVGKYQGQHIEDIPSKSLIWYIKTPWFYTQNRYLCDVCIVEELEKRGYSFKENSAEVSSEQKIENDSI